MMPSTATDRDQTHVAVGAGDRVVPHVAHAAPVLQAGVGHFAAQASGLEFGHRGQFGHVLARDVLLGSVVDQRAQTLDLGLQLGQTKVDDLVVDQRLAEGLAFAAVFDGVVHAGLQPLENIGGAKQPLLLELHHLHHEAGPFLAEQVALGYAHVIEEHLGGF